MSKAAKSVFIYGMYLFLSALVMLFLPNEMMAVFDFPVPEGSDIFIRFTGMVFFFLAFYYILAARREVVEFMRWTVYTRSLVILFFIGFVVFGGAPPLVVVGGVVDLAAAFWTARALRADQHI